MKKRQLRKNEIKDFENILKKKFGLDLSLRKKRVEEIILANLKLLAIENEVLFFYDSSNLVPTLKLIAQEPVLNEIIVDMGAVKFVVKGADVMRPGIVEFDSFGSGEIVVIRDLNHKKPLAIGRALFSSDEIKEMVSGKVIKNLHYVGDKIWNFER
jgi:PUA domain protein